MKVKTLSALAGLGGALIMTGTASAAVTSLSVFAEPVGGAGAPPAGGPRVIYRVYANMGASNERVNAWGGGGNLGIGAIVNTLGGGGPGTGFTNVGGVAALAPSSPGSTRDWDTYATIGVLYASEGPGGINATSIVTGTPGFIVGNSWTALAAGGGFFITPADAQGGADFRVSGNDTATRVLLMQLVVNAGEHVAGTIGIAWQGPTGGGVNTTGWTFNSVPAPGALALLGLAGLVGARRRRG